MEALIAATPGLAVPGFGADAGSANFADWPFTYDDLEPFYAEVEQLYGVQGDADRQSVRVAAQPPVSRCRPASRCTSRSASRTARAATSFLGGPLHPAHLPGRDHLALHRRRPPALRRLRAVQRLRLPEQLEGRAGRDHAAPRAPHRKLPAALQGAGDPARERRDGRSPGSSTSTPTARSRPPRPSAFILAASPIESARLCLLSGDALGNSSGQVGRNLMFHFQTNVNGFLPERVHGQRGRAVTHGISDFRGVEPGGADRSAWCGTPTGRTSTWAASASSARRRACPSPRTATSTRFQLPGALGRRFGHRTQERAARRGPRPAPLRPDHAGGGRAAARPTCVDLDPTHPRRLRPARPAGHVRAARLREELPRLLRAVPAPGGHERRGAHRAVFVAPVRRGPRRSAVEQARDGDAAHGERCRRPRWSTPAAASTTSTTSTPATAACSRPRRATTRRSPSSPWRAKIAHGIAGTTPSLG